MSKADEMFYEMGFYPTPDGYEHAEENEVVRFLDDGVWFENDGWCMNVSPEKVLACAERIKEMEEDNERSKT